MFARLREGHHFGMFRENGMHRAPQVADAFTVNDAHFKNPALDAGGQIIQHEFLDYARPERVQIENAFNRKFDWPVHASS